MAGARLRARSEDYGWIMRDPVAFAPRLAKLTVAIDVVVRCGALAVAYTLVRDLWDEVWDAEADTDGLAGPIFLASVVYVVWSVLMLVTSARRWRRRSVGDPELLAVIGGLSAVRLLVIREIADDQAWFTPGSWLLDDPFLGALAIGSGTCAVVAGIAFIQIVQSPADRVDGHERATVGTRRRRHERKV